LPSSRTCAVIFAAAIAAVALFQIALALGAPLGRFAMGGAFDGAYPPSMRVAALVQVVLYIAMAVVVLVHGGAMLPSLRPVARVAIWVVVAIGFVSLVLNLITPSAGERMLWAPVALVLFLTSLRVALAKAP